MTTKTKKKNLKDVAHAQATAALGRWQKEAPPAAPVNGNCFLVFLNRHQSNFN